MIRPLVLLRLYLDEGTQNISDRAVEHPSRSYTARVLSWGSVDRSIPYPAGLLQVNDASIVLDDSEGSVREWFATVTPFRRLGELKIVNAGESESAVAPKYIGEIVPGGVSFEDGIAKIQLHDASFTWLDDQIPGLINRDNFPNLVNSVSTAFLPDIYGRIESYADTDVTVSPAVLNEQTRQGAITCILLDTSLNRYGVARHACNAVLRVYRKQPDDTFYSLVNSSEYSVVNEVKTIGGIDYNITYIQLHTQQPDGVDIRADVSGRNARAAIGSMGAVSGELRNAVDAVLNLLLQKETRAARYNTARFIAARTACAALLCDGAFVEPLTYREALSQILTCFGIDFFHDQAGQFNIAFDGALSISSTVDEDLMDIGTFRPSYPKEVFTQLICSAMKNYAEGDWAFKLTLDNLDDEAELSAGGADGVIGTTIELPFIRDEDTAVATMSARLGYFTLRSWLAEFSVPSPEVDTELADILGVSHFAGLGSLAGWTNEPVKVYGAVLDLAGLTLLLKIIRRYPASALNIQSSWTGTHPPAAPTVLRIPSLTQQTVATHTSLLASIAAHIITIVSDIASVVGTITSILTLIGVLEGEIATLTALFEVVAAIEGEVASLTTVVGEIQTEIEEILSSITSLNAAITALGTDLHTHYTTTTGLMTILEGYVTDAELTSALAGYYTSSYIDAHFYTADATDLKIVTDWLTFYQGYFQPIGDYATVDNVSDAFDAYDTALRGDDCDAGPYTGTLCRLDERIHYIETNFIADCDDVKGCLTDYSTTAQMNTAIGLALAGYYTKTYIDDHFYTAAATDLKVTGDWRTYYGDYFQPIGEYPTVDDISDAFTAYDDGLRGDCDSGPYTGTLCALDERIHHIETTFCDDSGCGGGGGGGLAWSDINSYFGGSAPSNTYATDFLDPTYAKLTDLADIWTALQCLDNFIEAGCV